VSGPAGRRVTPSDALRASFAYHFRDGTVDDVFARHGSVQFDPLAPLGTSHDLVFGARVPGYRIGDWHDAVQRRRRAYDGWDKQASLVAMEGQPARRRYHDWHGARWMAEVDRDWPRERDEVLAQLEQRGPLEAAEIDLDVRVEAWRGSWYGPRLAKRIVRALWHAGRIGTRERRAGRHVYDLIERVLPREVLERPDPDPDAALRTLVLDRHRAAGVLRPEAPRELWSVPVPASERRAAIATLVEEGRLLPLRIGEVRVHAVPEWLRALEGGRGLEGARFVAPLDPLVWDREGLRRAFDFDYLWEVYKPADRRRWGWYVLPVAGRDRFLGRLEGALETRPDGERVWRIDRWWWEEAAAPVRPGPLEPRMADDLERAAARFAHYLGAGRALVRGGVPRAVAAALRTGAASGWAPPTPAGGIR
jgi:uncharacterized protein YcaQ